MEEWLPSAAEWNEWTTDETPIQLAGQQTAFLLVELTCSLLNLYKNYNIISITCNHSDI